MRLFLLPISTQRTLLYCQRLHVTTTDKQSLVDKATSRAAKLWSDWEKKESGWQKTVVTYGNAALKRIPYEEWGLKSVPPLSARRRDDELQGKEKVQLVYPKSIIPSSQAINILHRLGTERQALHKSRLIWCVVGMPITLPFALVPVIPNFPLFYLIFRAWSHWRAEAGGNHIQFLVSKKLVELAPSEAMDKIYTTTSVGLRSSPPSSGAHADSDAPLGSKQPVEALVPEEDSLLLTQDTAKELARTLELPHVGVELDRAIWQVDNAIRKAKEDETKAANPQESKPEGDESDSKKNS